MERWLDLTSLFIVDGEIIGVEVYAKMSYISNLDLSFYLMIAGFFREDIHNEVLNLIQYSIIFIHLREVNDINGFQSHNKIRVLLGDDTTCPIFLLTLYLVHSH